MQLKHIFIYIILILFFLFSSCEKIFFEKEINNSPENNFEYLWKEVNNKYAFLNYKNVDWSAVYAQYRPMIYSTMTDDSLFKVLSLMLNELKDGHVNLFSSFNVSRYNFDELYQSNINKDVIIHSYLKDNYYITGDFYHNFISNNEIGYIYYPSFANSIISDDELDYIIKRYADTKGLILDIRQNGGGIVQNVFTLLSRFTNEDKTLYTTRIKNGSGSNDFSTFEICKLTNTDKIKYLKPVIVLIDRGSYSASSFFAISTLAFDNIKLVGDTTGGGLGLPNGGQLPNGWTYRFSITETLTNNGDNFENGVPPTYPVILEQEYVNIKKDNVIETAIAIIKHVN